MNANKIPSIGCCHRRLGLSIRLFLNRSILIQYDESLSRFAFGKISKNPKFERCSLNRFQVMAL